MRPTLSVLCLALMAALAVTGCQEVGRRRVSVKPEIDERAWQVRPQGAPAPAAPSEGLGGEEAAGEPLLYRVCKTDTLVSISQRFYRDGRYSHKIYDANQTIIAQAGGVKRGMVLTIPPIGRRQEQFPDLRP